MKKIALFFALLCTAYVHAQVVSNVRAMQQDTTLVIVYDLKSSATTSLQVSFDGGKSFIPARSVNGDIGKTYSGNNRIVYWNATKDAGYFDCDKMVFKVIASGRNLYDNAGIAGHQLSYRSCHVYQEGNDITRGYKNFLKENCPEAHRAYKRKWHGMFWGGLLTTCCMAPFTVGAVLSNNSFGMGVCFGLMSTCILTGIPLMCCSTVAARKHSVKVYNNTCGLMDATAFEYNNPIDRSTLQLSLTPTNNGVGLSLQF